MLLLSLLLFNEMVYSIVMFYKEIQTFPRLIGIQKININIAGAN